MAIAAAAIWTGAAAAPATQQLIVTFAITQNGKPAGCGAPLTDLGLSHVSAKLDEARLYVYDLQLIDGEGKRTPLILGRNDWQFANLALLDFKDARGGNTPCGKATPAKNVVVTGSAPPGAYEGLEFSVGVPIEAEVDGAKMSLNHSNVETAPHHSISPR